MQMQIKKYKHTYNTYVCMLKTKSNDITSYNKVDLHRMLRTQAHTSNTNTIIRAHLNQSAVYTELLPALQVTTS